MNKNLLMQIVKFSRDLATQSAHRQFSLFHVFFILLKQPIVAKLIASQKNPADLVFIKNYLDQKWETQTNESHAYQLQVQANVKTVDSSYISELIERSILIAEEGNRTSVEVYDILFALFSFKKSEEVFHFIKSGKINVDQLKEEVKRNRASYSINQVEFKAPTDLEDMPFLVNLNEKIKTTNKIEPVIGRDDEIEKIIYSLSKKRKNNVVLVGEAGTGKTAVAEGLALKIHEKNVPQDLMESQVFALDLGGLLAGTKYRGEFEKRLTKVIEIISNTKNAILFIDEIHMIKGAGSTGDGSMDASNILKPALAGGNFKCIGATTYKEYRNVFEKDQALARRFQKIDIKEPSVNDCVAILLGAKKTFETHHGVTYTETAIRQAVELSVKYIPDRFLPDKALDIIDEAAVLVKYNNDMVNKVVDTPAILKTVAKIARIPESQLEVTTQKKIVTHLDERLKDVIFGQDEAIKNLADVVQVSKAGLGNTNRPIGSFMFAGPTGVGKTELAVQLSKQLNMHLTRIDMSEFKGSETISKLIGTSPGYVGFDQEGLLTGAVSKNPHSVIIMDEIEKAHPQVLDILLQVLEYGELTDGTGKKANFKQAIIVCTTNQGSDEVTRPVLGINETAATDMKKDALHLIKQAFRPEFLNRFNKVVWFNHLDKKNIESVLNKNVEEINNTLKDRKIHLTLAPAVKEHLIKVGYDKNYGARPMARAVEDFIKVPLAKELIFEKIKNNSEVSVQLSEENTAIFKSKIALNPDEVFLAVTKERKKRKVNEPKSNKQLIT